MAGSVALPGGAPHCAGTWIGAVATLLRRRRWPRFWKDWQGIPVRGASGGLDLCGCIVLSLMSSSIREEDVRLPAGLELDHSVTRPDGTRPVIISFGMQEDVRPGFVPAILGERYLEFIVTVPGVRLADASGGTTSGPFGYLTLFYLNDLWATVLGQMMGFPKKASRIGTTENSYSICRLSGGVPILSAEFQISGQVVNPFQSSDFEPYLKFLNAPVIRRSPFGPFRCEGIEIAKDQSMMQPIEARVQVNADDIPGLPRGAHRFASAENQPMGACRVRYPWRLNRLRSCRDSGAALPGG